jgi:hypothetical protein
MACESDCRLQCLDVPCVRISDNAANCTSSRICRQHRHLDWYVSPRWQNRLTSVCRSRSSCRRSYRLSPCRRWRASWPGADSAASRLTIGDVETSRCVGCGAHARCANDGASVQRAKARADAHAESVARARERRVAGRPGEDAAITSVGAYAPPDLTAFEALPTAAPGTSPSSSTLSPEATAAWRRLNERRAAQSAATRDHGPAPAPAAAAATLDDDDEARYAPPPRLTFDLSDMLVVKPARSRKR